MAEGIFKKITQDRSNEFKIGSAGISALDGYPPTDDTIQVMREHGIDVTYHRSRRLIAPMVEESDHIYVMEHYHRDWILKLFPELSYKVELLANEDVPDPIRMSTLFYENVYGMIERCVQKIAEEL